MIYLTQAKQVNDALDGKDRRTQDIALMRYRRTSFNRLNERRNNAVTRAKVTLTDPTPAEPVAIRVDALRAAPIAAVKAVVTDEVSMLRVYDPFYTFEPNIDFSEWQKLSEIYSPSPALDEASTAMIRKQTAGLTDAEFNGMFAKLRGFLRLDTTRNDFLYHTRLYEWLNTDPTAEIETFNSRIYAELFKTPDSDKWLGLYSTDVYTALDGNGITK